MRARGGIGNELHIIHADGTTSSCQLLRPILELEGRSYCTLVLLTGRASESERR